MYLLYVPAAGLDGTSRFLAGNQAALHSMVSQQNAVALRNAAAAAAPLGGAPLILSPRLHVPTTLSAAAGMLNGSQPPPLIAAGDTQGLIYAQFAAANDYAAANYSGLVSPLLAATAAEYSADPSGGLFAR